MLCQELVELVTEYFEESLSPEERARFEAHLARCGYCTEYVGQMRTTVRLLGALDKPAPAPVLRAQMLELFRNWKQSGGESDQ